MHRGVFFMSEPNERTKLVNRIAGTDLLFGAGLLLTAAGLFAFDWRVALVVVGVVLMALALAAARRGE